MKLEHWNEDVDGPLSEEVLRERLESRGYQVQRFEYPPGTVFPDHTHEVDKVDGVVSGRFRMTMDGHQVILEAGDLLFVPRGTVHSADVVGDEPVVSLDATKP